MGCWNGTCGLTQLPIKYREPVVCYILKKNGYAEFGGGGFCYPTNQYKPILPPIEGVYDDYGSVEDIDSKYDYLNAYIVEEFTTKGMYKLVEKSDCTVPTTLKEFIDAVERGYVITREGNPLGFMLVHKEANDVALSAIGSRIPYSKEENLKDLYARDLAKLELRLGTMAISNPFEKMSILRESVFGEILDTFYDFIGYIGQACATLVDLALMDKFLATSRKFWTVQSGAGSQSSEYELANILGSWVSKKVEDVKKACVEDSSDEMDLEYATKELLWWSES